MYIVPDSKLRILKGIPINKSYKDTLYFASKTAQYNYFASQAIQGLTFEDYSYIRVNNNTIRVGVGAEDVYSANYLMFQNTSFGTKWFYAFVTNVEYINNACTEITFEIDRIQTWWFDVELRSCMVARQHEVNDSLYVNCEPENFAIDADITHYDTNLLNDDANATCYVTVTTGHMQNNVAQGTWIDSTGGVKDGLYSPLEILPWRNTQADIAELQAYLSAIIKSGKEDAILALYAAPKAIGVFITDNPAHSTVTIAKSTLRANAFQGYVPKNNKMYNYPFFKLELERAGSSQTYKVEDFRVGSTDVQSDNVQFEWWCVANPAPQVLVVPKSYQGMDLDINKGLDMAEFPQCPIKGDIYQMWVAQNASGYMANILGSLIGTVLNAGQSDIIGGHIGVRQTVQEIANFAGQSMNMRNVPDKVNGIGKPAILSNIGKNTFWLHAKSLNYWQARQIDTYFTMFGYAQNHVYVPNIHARQKWTYVQTAGCSIVGNAPADDIAFIQSRFDSGITWWVNASEVGRYDLTNGTLS